MIRQLEHTTYHKVLRVSALVMAFVLVFQSGMFSRATTQMTVVTGRYLAAAVGVSVGVPENDLNMLTRRIAELESQVGYKDAQLRERDLAIGLDGRDESQLNVTLILAGIQFVLLVLIVMNYTFDYLRARRKYITA